MRSIECGIKAFDVHELLCHFIAKRLGFYREAGLEVRVVDVTFTPDEKLPRSDYFQVACGAAYLGRRDGHPFKVYLAATTRPMFWLYGLPDCRDIESLRGKRIATHAPVAPPYWFNRIVIRKHGLDPDRDVELWPARDDIIRLGMLREGDVSAAVISSAVSPVYVEECGLSRIALLGDEFNFVTTGVATSEETALADPGLVSDLVAIFRKSLEVIHNDDEAVVGILSDILAISDRKARKTYELIKPCYTSDGYIDLDLIQDSLNTMDSEIGVPKSILAPEFYDYRFVKN